MGRTGANLPVAAGVMVTKDMIDVAELMVAGYSYPEISKKTGVSTNTIHKWYREDADFKSVVAKFTEGLMAEIKVELVVSARQALETLQELLKSDNEQIKLSASKDILDRAGFKAANKQEVDVRQTVNYFATMSDDELAKFIDINANEVIDVESVQGSDGAGSTGEDGVPEETE